jgi:hypothetical protein
MARKEKQYHFIYKTTNSLNGKYYYGMHSTYNLNDGYYGSGRRLKRSLNKYGKENHVVEIVEHLPDRKSLINREREIVNLNEIAKEKCMNLMIGGKGGFPANFDEKSFHEKGGKVGGNIHAERLKGDIEYAKRHKENWDNMMKKAQLTKKCYHDWTGEKHTNEEKRKIGFKNSIKQKGSNNSQYGTCWINNGIVCKKIKKEEFHLYSNNWILGRKIKICIT